MNREDLAREMQRALRERDDTYDAMRVGVPELDWPGVRIDALPRQQLQLIRAYQAAERRVEQLRRQRSAAIAREDPDRTVHGPYRPAASAGTTGAAAAGRQQARRRVPRPPRTHVERRSAPGAD